MDIEVRREVRVGQVQVRVNGHNEASLPTRVLADVVAPIGADTDAGDRMGRRVAALLQAVPEPKWDEHRSHEVWQRIESSLEARRRRTRGLWASLALVSAGLAAGRMFLGLP